MDSQILNKRKNDLYEAQELTLNQAQESKVKLTPAQEEAFKNQTAEIEAIDQTIARMAVITAGKAAIAKPTSSVVIPGEKKNRTGVTALTELL